MSNESKKFDIETYWTAISGKFVKQEVPQAQLKTKTKFERDLAKGQASEHNFFMKYQHCITRTDGRRGDFEINKTGEVLELKTDSYDPRHTDNFFMERHSYDNKPGGPWQSQEHNVSYYLYWFPITADLFIFNVNELVYRLTKIEKTLQKINVKNEGYTTVGYKVPRDQLRVLFLQPEDIGLFQMKEKVKRSFK